jgi:NitT/TauT family transport system permease protein
MSSPTDDGDGTGLAGRISDRLGPLGSTWGRGLIGVLVLFCGAEALTRAELVTPQYLPPASVIVGETVGLFANGEFYRALWVTLQACLIGLGLAVVVAVPLGLAMGLSRPTYQAAITIVELLRPIPSVALIPLAILLYGRGTEMKVALVIYACAWPLLFNTIYGIRSVDPVAVSTAKVFGLGRLATSVRVYLPASAPFIFTGLKIAASIAVILAVSGELVAGGSGGIGILMGEASAGGNQRRVYALTIMTGLLGLVLNLVFGAIQRRLFAWQETGTATT